MRKWVVATMITVAFLAVITTSQASFDGIKLADYPKDSVLYQSINNETSLQHLNQIIVLPENLFNQKEAAAIINRIGSLPDFILKNINNHGIILKLFTGKLTDNPTASKLAGQTPRGYHSKTTWDDVPGIGGTKVVLVKIGHSEQGKGHGSINLELHEMAHSIDRYLYENISKSKEFQMIWEEERGLIFPGNIYLIMYPEEYLAETFAMYYLNESSQNLLESKAPRTYHFIKNLQ
ncbi:toxin [Neobacillus sp. FSL H8-0543]|uniref:anthrax toxin lethal factor-related metalloendopeptidase n=1 Tax=Neobacillus sp. FSL H8-0543 TaxID=2954672 RepID=UPI00315866A4